VVIPVSSERKEEVAPPPSGLLLRKLKIWVKRRCKSLL
jgi:hypothetical protein